MVARATSHAPWTVVALRVSVTALIGIVATIVATSAACDVAMVRGPQFDVVLGPIDPTIESAAVFVMGTMAGAVAVVCGLRLWSEIRSHWATRPPSVTDSRD